MYEFLELYPNPLELHDDLVDSIISECEQNAQSLNLQKEMLEHEKNEILQSFQTTKSDNQVEQTEHSIKKIEQDYTQSLELLSAYFQEHAHDLDIYQSYVHGKRILEIARLVLGEKETFPISQIIKECHANGYSNLQSELEKSQELDIKKRSHASQKEFRSHLQDLAAKPISEIRNVFMPNSDAAAAMRKPFISAFQNLKIQDPNWIQSATVISSKTFVSVINYYSAQDEFSAIPLIHLCQDKIQSIDIIFGSIEELNRSESLTTVVNSIIQTCANRLSEKEQDPRVLFEQSFIFDQWLNDFGISSFNLSPLLFEYFHKSWSASELSQFNEPLIQSISDWNSPTPFSPIFCQRKCLLLETLLDLMPDSLTDDQKYIFIHEFLISGERIVTKQISSELLSLLKFKQDVDDQTIKRISQLFSAAEMLATQVSDLSALLKGNYPELTADGAQLFKSIDEWIEKFAETFERHVVQMDTREYLLTSNLTLKSSDRLRRGLADVSAFLNIIKKNMETSVFEKFESNLADHVDYTFYIGIVKRIAFDSWQVVKQYRSDVQELVNVFGPGLKKLVYVRMFFFNEPGQQAIEISEDELERLGEAKKMLPSQQVEEEELNAML